MARRTKRVSIDRGQWDPHAAAGDQFFAAARGAAESGYWNAAGLLYVHAAIAFADAVSILRRGEKSSSENHLDALALFEEATAGIQGRDEASAHLRRVLDEKNRVAYQGVSFRRTDLDTLAKHAGRFREFSERLLRG